MRVQGAAGIGILKGWTVSSKSQRFLVIGMCASLAAVSPARSQPAATAPGTLANGTWTVQGREIPGTRCGHWLVRLTNMHGSLSGVLSLARASVPIQNLALAPDGSFSGTTPAGVVGTTHARAYQVTGRFVGDTVHVTLETNFCPARHGVATRRPGGR
jgi:hypothetical protein